MEEKKADVAAPSTTVAPASQPAAEAATSAPSPTAPTVPVHCPYRRTTDLLQRLAPNKMRIGFFIGAGCSLSIQGTNGEPLIPEIAGLTAQVKDSLDKDDELRTVAQTAWDRVLARSIPVPTVEDVLSHIRTLKSLCGEGEIDGFSADKLDKLDIAICEQIRQIVSKSLPTSATATPRSRELDSGNSAREARRVFYH